MQRVKRVMIYSVLFMLLVTVLFAVAASSRLYSHECTGMQCEICLAAEHFRLHLECLLFVFSAVVLSGWTISAGNRHQSSQQTNPCSDPVSLRVKLTN